MSDTRTALLWQEALVETLWGRRGIVKVVALCLTVALSATRAASAGLPERWAVCLQLFAAVACWSQMAILANELSDRAPDQAAGKRRWICRLPPMAGVMVTTLYPVIGFVALAAAGGTGVVLALYGVAVALALLYSVKPVRMKERGIWGVLGYVVCAATGLTIVPCVMLRSDWLTLAILAPAVALDKSVNLQFHQIIDYEGDRRAGIRTCVTEIGLSRAKSWLGWVSWLATFWLFATIVFAVVSLPTWRTWVAYGMGAVLLAVSAYSIGQRRRDEATELVRNLPWPYLTLTYVAFRALPIVLLARLTLQAPAMWTVACVATALVLIESWQSFRYRLP